MLARLLDGSRFDEFKARCAATHWVEMGPGKLHPPLTSLIRQPLRRCNMSRSIHRFAGTWVHQAWAALHPHLGCVPGMARRW